MGSVCVCGGSIRSRAGRGSRCVDLELVMVYGMGGGALGVMHKHRPSPPLCAHYTLDLPDGHYGAREVGGLVSVLGTNKSAVVVGI